MASRQVVLVTGCSSGIGRATAIEAARRGHEVFATARAEAGVADLQGRDGIRTLLLDVTDRDSIRGAVAAAFERAGRLDALVNNAGYGQYGAVEDVTPEQWRGQFEVNFFGAVETIQAVLPFMRKAGRGTIVNVSSVAGKVSFPFAAPYSAAKHALEALSDALRVEVAPFGIRVAVIEAGPIATKFTERARAGVAPFLSRPGPYAAFYGGAERAMAGDFQAGALPPEAVARVIVDAIEAEKPETRYRITRLARALILLRRFLPDRFFDRRMKKILGLPDRVPPHG